MLRNLAALGALVLPFSVGVSAEPSHPSDTPDRRPNILFCIADDWGWPHAGMYRDPVVKTPAFDRVAREGILFEYAYVSSPSCTPSRNAILTGQYHWQLEEGANLGGWLDKKHAVYPLLLERAGYHVGHWRKSWGPRTLAKGGYVKGEHPAGKQYAEGFERFLDARPKGAPFCFWLGSGDPHRDYDPGSGARSGMDLSKVPVPSFWPDAEQVRSDIADYYFEVQRFDSDVAAAIALLETRGELENTIVVVTGDHGMPFPRCKSNIYEMGVHVPLAIRWGANLQVNGRGAGRRVDAFVSLIDLAPTFLEAAGVAIPEAMSGRSLVPLILDMPDAVAAQDRSSVVYGMERHTAGRPGRVGYPCRGIRTAGFAYIRNYKPDRWPAGDPPMYSDVDPANSWGHNVTKSYILENEDQPNGRRFYDLCFGKRPAEELYDMTRDPDQVRNLTDDPAHAEVLAKMRTALDAELLRTDDPRLRGVELDQPPRPSAILDSGQ